MVKSGRQKVKSKLASCTLSSAVTEGRFSSGHSKMFNIYVFAETVLERVTLQKTNI